MDDIQYALVKGEGITLNPSHLSRTSCRSDVESLGSDVVRTTVSAVCEMCSISRPDAFNSHHILGGHTLTLALDLATLGFNSTRYRGV